MYSTILKPWEPDPRDKFRCRKCDKRVDVLTSFATIDLSARFRVQCHGEQRNIRVLMVDLLDLSPVLVFEADSAWDDMGCYYEG